VTREECIELYNTALIGLVDAAQEGLVKVGLIAAVTVAASNDTGVDTGGVAVPQLKINRGNGLTGVDIDDLDVEVERNTLLVLRDVLTDQLALDPVGALSDLRGENAGVVAGEEDGRVGVGSDAGQVGSVGSSEDGVQVTSTEVVLLCRNGK
jgi:hypothetical protein